MGRNSNEMKTSLINSTKMTHRHLKLSISTFFKFRFLYIIFQKEGSDLHIALCVTERKTRPLTAPPRGSGDTTGQIRLTEQTQGAAAEPIPLLSPQPPTHRAICLFPQLS